MTQHTIAALAAPPTLGKYSASIPFLRRPKYLTGRYAGDVGFDPLGLATSMEVLVNYREAEVKHARIAMLVSCEAVFTNTNLEFDSTLHSCHHFHDVHVMKTCDSHRYRRVCVTNSLVSSSK